MESIKFSLEGIDWGFRNERNIKIQFIVGALAIFAGILFKLSLLEFLIVLLWTGLVISAEFFNTAIEKALDAYKDDFSPTIKIIKDLCASAVFILAVLAVASGIMIFLPHIIAMISLLIKGA